MLKQRVFLFAILFAIINTIFFCNTDIHAIDGFTVSPVRTEIDILPGTQKTGNLTVKNETNKLMEVGFSAESFSVINQYYDYQFTAETNVADWVGFQDKKIELKPGEEKKITYTIGVPLESEPGGRYISIFVSNDTKNDNDGIAARQRIASLLYITVTGDVTRSGELISLNTPWFITDNNDWSIVVRNSGTTHFRSRFNTVVSDMFKNKIGENIMDESMLLPGTIKLINGKFQTPNLPGIYKVTYTIGLGDNPAVVQERYVLYMPIWLILLFVGAIVLFSIERFYKHKSIN